MHRTFRVLAGAAGIAVFTVVLCGSVGSAADLPSPDRVMFVVVPGVRWSSMPSAVDGWAKASLALNSVSRQRPIDVYLTMGKGRRTGGLSAVAGVGPLDSGRDGVSIRLWGRFEQHDGGLRFGGHLGALGGLLETHGVPFAVVGRSAEAAALGADQDGRLRRFVVAGPNEALPALGQNRLVIVESDVADLERLVPAAVGACLIVASGSVPDNEGHLGALAVSPECGLGRAGLVSPSTRQPGFVTLGDLAPTLLSLVGIDPPNAFEGGVIRAARSISRARLVEEDRRAAVGQDSGTPVTVLFLLAAAAGFLGLARERVRLPVAAVLLGMPPALLLMMLLPWWRYGPLAGVMALLVIAGLLAAAALRAFARDPPKLVLVSTTVTAAVIAVDALHRGTLELDAPMLNNAIGAGRFAGVGNVAFGFLIAASLAAGAVALDRYQRRALAAVVAGLAFSVVADGAPMFGADVGGLLAGVPAVGALLIGWRRRLTRWAPLLFVAVGLGVGAGVAAFDMTRPAGHQTHLGRTLTGGSAGQTIVRRELTALESIGTSAWVIIVVVVVIGLVVARHRLPTGPAARAGLRGIAVAAIAGTVLNDSGVAVAGPVLFVTWAVALALLQPDRRPVGRSADCMVASTL
jgi:hypothetical protein